MDIYGHASEYRRMSSRSLTLLAAALLFAARLFAAAGEVSPAQPVIPDRTFNLKDFGAVADGTTLNTDAFKRAVAAVDKAGGGTLIVPAGKYATGPVDLCSAINLPIEADATIF